MNLSGSKEIINSVINLQVVKVYLLNENKKEKILFLLELVDTAYR